MRPDEPTAGLGHDDDAGGPLGRALMQSEHVQDKVRRAAADLSSANAALKHAIRSGISLPEIELVSIQSEAALARVHEAVEDLGILTDMLSREMDERGDLERRLALSGVALSQSRAQERRSRHDALHDAATGLPNMSLFIDRVANALAQARRHSRRLAVLFLDLDEFKIVNDTHGHDAGDRVLHIIAHRLETGLRRGDTATRRGGDEFVILMLDISEEAAAATFATRLQERIAEPCEVDGVSVIVKPSIGIATYPGDGHSAEELIKNSDLAMYAAKKSKRGSLLYRELAGRPGETPDGPRE